MKLGRTLRRALIELSSGSWLVLRDTPNGPRAIVTYGLDQFAIPLRKARRLAAAGHVKDVGNGREYEITPSGRRLLDRRFASGVPR